jgi:hypothetical protein
LLPGNPPAAQPSCPPATANIAPRSVIGVRCHHIPDRRLGAHDDQLSVVWFHVQIVPFGGLRLFQ